MEMQVCVYCQRVFRIKPNATTSHYFCSNKCEEKYKEESK